MPPRHSSAPSRRRRSPLLIAAVVLLVLVTGATGFLLLTRQKRRPVDDADVARLMEAVQSNEDRRADARATARVEDPSVPPHGAAEVPSPDSVPPDGGPAEVPVWARPPRVLVTPFPEGGRFNPPLPPVKLLPEMLDPPSAVPDAGASD